VNTKPVLDAADHGGAHSFLNGSVIIRQGAGERFPDSVMEGCMKKIVLAAVVCVIIAGPVMAGGVRDNCGVGLGTYLLDDKEPTLLVQCAATILNGVCANQTFAITSGTLGANPYTALAGVRETEQFIGDNMDRLALEMATGHGDTLAALGNLMGVQQAEQAAFNARLQSNFGRIFTSEQVTASEVLAGIQSVTQG